MRCQRSVRTKSRDVLSAHSIDVREPSDDHDAPVKCCATQRIIVLLETRVVRYRSERGICAKIRSAARRRCVATPSAVKGSPDEVLPSACNATVSTVGQFLD